MSGKRVIKKFLIVPIVAVMLLTGCSTDGKHEDDYAYSLKFEFPNDGTSWIKGRLEKINVRTLKLEKGYSVDPAINNITIHNERVLLSYHRDKGEYLRKITEFFPKTGFEKEIIETVGSGPKEIVPVMDKLYVRVDSTKKPDSLVEKSSGQKSKFQRSGYEVYSDEKKPKYLGPILLNQYDYIESSDVGASSFYIAIRPYNVSDNRYASGIRYNAFDDAFLALIDINTNEVKRRVDVSGLFRGIRGIKEIGNKLYITASHFPDYHGSLHGDAHFKYIFEKENPGEKYTSKRPFKSSGSPGLMVFDKRLNLLKSINIGPRADELHYDPINSYVIVEHKPLWLRDKTGYMSILDLSTHKVVKSFKIPGYKTMSLVCKDTLLISSEEGLYVFDTKQLGVIKKFPGYYAPISVEYSKEKFKIEREVTLPVIQTGIVEVDMSKEFPEGKLRKVSRYK
jgi:hypothetical protein